MSAVSTYADGLVLRLYIQPKASRDTIIGLHGDEVKVAITAPPVDGQANAHLVKYLAKQFRVAKSQVLIEKGELGRHKQVKILNPQQIPTEVAALIQQDKKKKKVVLATGNAGKVRELASLLNDFGLDVIAQTELGVDSAEETGLTFIENAILKARHAAQVTGLPAIADDSGLAVDALGGAPGIYSARYSGVDASDQQNLEKLLETLKDVPDEQRKAQFHCVLVYMRHAEDPTPLVCHGSWPGVIAREAAGNGGFGYDPIFFVPSEGKTAAELTREEKSAISHRGRALKLLLEALRNG